MTKEKEKTPRRQGQGFAALSPEKIRELASKGGKAAQQAGTAHRWSHEEAVAAGKKGGAARHGKAPKSGGEG